MAKSPYPPIPLFNMPEAFVINSTNQLYVPFESTTLSIADIIVMSLFILAHMIAIILAFVFLRVGYKLKKQKEEVQVLKNVQSAKEQFSPNRQSMKNPSATSSTIKLSENSASSTAELLEVNVTDISVSPAMIGNHLDIGNSSNSFQSNRNTRGLSNGSDAQNSTTSISTPASGSVFLNVGDQNDNISVSSAAKTRQSSRLTTGQPSNHHPDSDGMTKNQRILFILMLFLLFFQVTSLVLLIIHHALNFSGHVLIDNYILKRNNDIASGVISETAPIELVPSKEFRIADRFVGMFQAIVGASCYLIILYILCFIETVFIKTVQKTGTMSKRTAQIITTISVVVTIITTSLIFVSIVSSCVMILLVKSGVISDDELSASLPGAALFIFQVVFHNVIFNLVGFKVLRTISQYSSKLNKQSSERPFYRVIILQIGLTVFTIIHLLGAVCLALYPSWEFFDVIAFALSSVAILGYTTIIFFLYRPLFKDARDQAREMKKLLAETQHD